MLPLAGQWRSGLQPKVYAMLYTNFYTALASMLPNTIEATATYTENSSNYFTLLHQFLLHKRFGLQPVMLYTEESEPTPEMGAVVAEMVQESAPNGEYSCVTEYVNGIVVSTNGNPLSSAWSIYFVAP